MPQVNDLLLTGGIVKAAAGKPRRLRIVAYRGGLMVVEPHGPVVIDLSGLDLPESVPVLDGHENVVDAVIGRGRPEVANGELVVSVDLANTPAAERVLAALEAGVELQASVGVNPVETSRLAGEETVAVNGKTIEVPRGGALLVKRGVLKEVSVLPLGADDTTEVRIAARRARMEDTTVSKDAQIERERVLRIRDLCAEGFAEIESRAIREGWSPERTELEVLRAKARRAELEAIRASRPSIAGVRTTGGGVSGVPARDLLAAAVLLHAGKQGVAEKYIGPRAAQAAEDLKARSLLDIAAAALRLAGQDMPHDRNEMVRAAFSMTSLPIALGASAEKIALGAYREAPASWRGFARIVSLANFREHSLIRATWGGEFERVPPQGELKYGAIGEQVFTVRGETFGQILAIDRQHIDNDDLGLFMDASAALGRAAARAVADEVYRVLLNNQTPDGSAFFSTANANLLTGAYSALGSTGLEKAIQSFRGRVDSEGRNLDVVPRVLLVPDTLEVTARQLLQSTTVARDTATGGDRLPEGNVFRGMLDLAVEPRLTNSQRFANTSTTAWYLFGGPQDGAVVVGFLNGREQPVIEQVNLPPDQLGVGFRGYVDFGVVLGDPFSAVRSDGV